MRTQILGKLQVSKKELVLIALGCFIMAFGIVNVHTPSKITEGGVLGFVLFSHKVLGLDPSIVSFVVDIVCYLLAISIFGFAFLSKALIASSFFAASYKLALFIGPVLPNLYDYPLLAAVIGGLFIGVGCGLVVTQGGAAGGDDALAMVISDRFNTSISRAYLITDGVVLLLSLTYLSPDRLVFSFISTLISSFLIGQFEIYLSKPAARSLA